MPYFTCNNCSLLLYTAALRLRLEECPCCGAGFDRSARKGADAAPPGPVPEQVAGEADLPAPGRAA